jgi:hypothetical protein
MEQHLTLAEARDLTGKSESTIKRKIHDVTSDPAHPDRPLILPPADEVERRKASREPYAWKVNRSLLLRWFPPDESASKPAGGGDRAATANDAVIEVLRQQLHSKDQQIETLSKQLDRKDEQITALNERQREFNVLMGQLQERLAIAGPRAAGAEPILASEPAATPTSKAGATPPKKAKPSKRKRGLFGFFRNSK